MSIFNPTRRGLLRTGAIAGASLALPTYLRADGHSGFANAPQGDTVTLGFNVPQSGAYADEGADELRALVQTRADGSILLQCVPAARDREGSAQYAARVARAPSWLRLRLTPGEALRGAFWVHSRHARREWPTG